MLKITRWCIAHRRSVFVAWLAIAVLTTVLASAAGRNYANNFTLPGTESQRVIDLLTKEFPTQSGDVDQLVFHVRAPLTIDSPSVRAAMTPLLARAATFPHVVAVISPYSSRGAVQVSHDRRTAFETIFYSKRANLLPNNTGAPLVSLVKHTRIPGVTLAAGGQVVEQAEGFNIGPATVVGVVAALVILLITFGSMIAAGMPLITAGFGLVTGVALIGLATHVTSMANVSPDLALMIGLGVGIDYALFVVTRFRENYLAGADVQGAIVGAMDTAGRAVLFAGATVIIALLGQFALGVEFLRGLAVASALAVLMTMLAALTVLPAFLARFGERVARPRRRRAKSNAARGPA